MPSHRYGLDHAASTSVRFQKERLLESDAPSIRPLDAPLRGLRWWLRMPDHVFANGSFRNLESRLEKFVMDSGCSSAHIISTQSPNEVARFFRDTWPPWLSMANLPGPVPTETGAVPIDHGIRFHDPECLTPSEPELRQTDPETSI